MRKQQQLGLVVGGNSTGSAILRLPTMAEELGPIKSPAVGVASRVSNFLRAGYVVSDYEELAAARLILLRVPDASVPRIVEEICASELVLRDLSFVLCESWLSMEALAGLGDRGAYVATLVVAPTAGRDWFILEGQTRAVRQARRFIERNNALALEVRPGMKSLYFAAELLANTLPRPLYATAQQALRVSGISGKRLYALLNEIAREMFVHFLKGGRMWEAPLSECSPETANAHLRRVRDQHPEIAEVVDRQLAWAMQRLAENKQPPRANDKTALYRQAAST